jgi:hypothetical protein
MDSERFRSGNLPMSSARMESTAADSSRLTFSALARLERKPVTTTSDTASWLSAAGAAGAACRAAAGVAARPKQTAAMDALANHTRR